MLKEVNDVVGIWVEDLAISTEDGAGERVSLNDRRQVVCRGEILPPRCPQCDGNLETELLVYLTADPEGKARVVGGPGKFCTECPVMVLDEDFFSEAVEIALPDEYEFARRNEGTSRLDLTRNLISRNGPCPCGSGQKHKRCCGRARRAS